MKKLLTAVATLCALTVLVSFTSTVRAANEPAKQEATKTPSLLQFNGLVTAINAQSMTLEVTFEGAKQTFQVNANTKIMREGKKLKFDGIGINNYVKVLYLKEADGKFVARSIDVTITY